MTGPIKSEEQQRTNFLSLSYEAFNREMTLTTNEEDPLADYITSFWKIDSSAKEIENETPLSKDDTRALKILNDTVRHNGERYEISLLWKEKVNLEKNYPVAKAKNQSLEKKLSKDQLMKEMYQKTLDTDIEMGHVKPVIFSSITPSRAWYLPHHPVTNPNKPGKVRRFSNAASVFKVNTLNSLTGLLTQPIILNLLLGPDLNNNLVGLLLRVRENAVAISADIEAMFIQVGIIEKNQPSMRFLWPINQSVEQFQYTRLIFGA